MQGIYRITLRDRYNGAERIIQRDFLSENHARHYGEHDAEQFECIESIELLEATAPEPCTPAEPERTTEGSRPAGYITLEVSASIMVPYNEAGAIQLQKDGREQAEENFAAAIIERLESKGNVSVTTCACSIVHPENLFTGHAMCSRCQYKDKAYPYCEYMGKMIDCPDMACDYFTPAEEASI